MYIYSSYKCVPRPCYRVSKLPLLSSTARHSNCPRRLTRWAISRYGITVARETARGIKCRILRVCMYIYTCTYINTYNIHTYLHALTHTHHTHSNTHTHTHTHAHTHTQSNTHTHTRTIKHTHTHSLTHTHTHTHRLRQQQHAGRRRALAAAAPLSCGACV